jgi:hypothetical protein
MLELELTTEDKPLRVTVHEEINEISIWHRTEEIDLSLRLSYSQFNNFMNEVLQKFIAIGTSAWKEILDELEKDT